MNEERARDRADRGSGAVREMLARAFDRFLDRGLRRMDRDGRWWEGPHPGAATREPMSDGVDRMGE
jgi:hypothetical protein